MEKYCWQCGKLINTIHTTSRYKNIPWNAEFCSITCIGDYAKAHPDETPQKENSTNKSNNSSTNFNNSGVDLGKAAGKAAGAVIGGVGAVGSAVGNAIGDAIENRRARQIQEAQFAAEQAKIELELKELEFEEIIKKRKEELKRKAIEEEKERQAEIKEKKEREEKEKREIAELIKKAESGDCDSQFRLGECYFLGKLNFKKDNNQAFYWLFEAFKKGSTKALIILMSSNFLKKFIENVIVDEKYLQEFEVDKKHYRVAKNLKPDIKKILEAMSNHGDIYAKAFLDDGESQKDVAYDYGNKEASVKATGGKYKELMHDDNAFVYWLSQDGGCHEETKAGKVKWRYPGALFIAKWYLISTEKKGVFFDNLSKKEKYEQALKWAKKANYPCALHTHNLVITKFFEYYTQYKLGKDINFDLYDYYMSEYTKSIYKKIGIDSKEVEKSFSYDSKLNFIQSLEKDLGFPSLPDIEAFCNKFPTSPHLASLLAANYWINQDVKKFMDFMKVTISKYPVEKGDKSFEDFTLLTKKLVEIYKKEKRKKLKKAVIIGIIILFAFTILF